MVSRSVPPVPGGTTMSYFILIPLSIMFFVNGGTWWRWLVTLVTHLEVFLHNMSRWTLPHFARLNVGLNVLGGHIQFFFFFLTSPLLPPLRRVCGDLPASQIAGWMRTFCCEVDGRDGRHQPAGWVVTPTLQAGHLLFNRNRVGTVCQQGLLDVQASFDSCLRRLHSLHRCLL